MVKLCRGKAHKKLFTVTSPWGAWGILLLTIKLKNDLLENNSKRVIHRNTTNLKKDLPGTYDWHWILNYVVFDFVCRSTLDGNTVHAMIYRDACKDATTGDF